MPGLLRRFRTALREGWHEPATHYGAVYEGRYEIKDSRASGVVKHQSDASHRPPTSVIVLREHATIGLTDHFEPHKRGWRFAVDVGSAFTTDDILKDRIRAFALDRLGQRSALRLDGAVQLSYLREGFGESQKLELTVDFSRNGNSKDYIRDGWYTAEAEHTWTQGSFSTVQLPLKTLGSPYRLEILAWPFVVPGQINEQSLMISMNGYQITRHFVRPGLNYLECEIPEDLTQSPSALIRLDHPDAARPCDFGAEIGTRVIALAVKTMKLRRRHPWSPSD